MTQLTYMSQSRGMQVPLRELTAMELITAMRDPMIWDTSRLPVHRADLYSHILNMQSGVKTEIERRLIFLDTMVR